MVTRHSPKLKVNEDGRVYEIQHGRNFIRTGDLVKVGPSRSGKHDGFLAKFRYASDDREGPFYALLALDEKGRQVAHRFIRPERVRRLSRTKHPQRP